MLRVERGQASEEDLAALTAVLLALRGSGQATRDEPPMSASPWWRLSNDYAAPGSWR
ncbi:acyl-CoA carboxylase epsilon subunit [Streptomyces sp. NPDC013978]|uniref:acyl-CoA carboxylase epsilon subunit n=1 Tax=Streptomyces sp. NPDC013978 TaxID=3364869 RepID=UPI0036FA0791